MAQDARTAQSDKRPAKKYSRIAIDNNAAERAIRDLALGHKYYCFAGSSADAEHQECVNTARALFAAAKTALG